MARTRASRRSSSTFVRASIDEATPVALFQGYDTFLNAGRSTAVSGSQQSAGANAETYYQVCTDFNSLQTALNVSASVSASFGFGSVGGKSAFIDQLEVTNTSVTIVVYTRIVSGSATVTNVNPLNPPPQDINAFYQAFGDSLVSQLITGAEYAATYVFYAETVADQQQIANTLTASGIGTGGSVTASLQATLIQVQQQISTRQTLQQFMSGFTNRPFPTADQIINFALDFNSEIPDSPVVISYDVTGYEHVPGIPDSFISVENTRSLYNGVGAQAGLSDQYAQLGALQNSINALQDVYAQYGYTGDALLNQNEITTDGNIQQLDQLFQQMAEDPTKTYTQPQLAGLALGQPSLSVAVTSVGAWGEGGGTPFNEISLAAVAQSQYLSMFSVHGGGWVDQIDYTYTSDQGSQTFAHGGPGGVGSPQIFLMENERITQVDVQFGQFVAWIQIQTTIFDQGSANPGKTFSWPPTTDGGAPASWSATDTEVFLGFSGQADGYLNQLSVVTGTFNPAVGSQIPG